MVLVFRHVPGEHLGWIGPLLLEHSVPYFYVDTARQTLQGLDIKKYSALIVLGGPMSVNDPLEYLKKEMQFIRLAHEQQIPVLGICLGAQLIAAAFGQRVYKNPLTEIGWFPIWWTEEGQVDPIFHDLPNPTMVFHWHGETFDLPSGAKLLAYSEACRHQAFVLDGFIYGLQFHLEASPEMILDWIGGETASSTNHIDPYAYAIELHRVCREVVQRWIEKFLAKPEKARG